MAATVHVTNVTHFHKTISAGAYKEAQFKYKPVEDVEATYRARMAGYFFPKLIEFFNERRTNGRIRIRASARLAEIIDEDIETQGCFTSDYTAYLRVAVSEKNVAHLLEVVKLLVAAGATNPYNLDIGTILMHKHEVNLVSVRDGLAVLGRTCVDREGEWLDLSTRDNSIVYKNFSPHNPLRSTRGEKAIKDAAKDATKLPARGGHPIILVATIAHVVNLLREEVLELVTNKRNKKFINMPFANGECMPQKRSTVRNMAGVLLYLAKQLSEVSRVEEITENAGACMHLVRVRVTAADAETEPTKIWVPLLACAIDVGLGSRVERTDEDDLLVVASETPKDKPKGEKVVTHRESFRVDLPHALNGIRTELEILAMAVLRGVAEPQRETFMLEPYIGMSASDVGNCLAKLYATNVKGDGRLLGDDVKGDDVKGLTPYGVRHKVAQEAVKVAPRYKDDLVMALKYQYYHTKMSNTMENVYADPGACIDVVPLPTKVESEEGDKAVLDGVRLLTLGDLSHVSVDEKRFATRRAIDAAVFFMHRTTQKLRGWTPTTTPSGTKRKRNAPPEILPAMIKSAFEAFSKKCDPDRCFSESQVLEHEHTLEASRLNTWNKLNNVLQKFPLRFDLDRVDLRLYDGVQIPANFKLAIEKAFVGGACRGGVPPPLPLL